MAGNGTPGYSGDNGPATSAELDYSHWRCGGRRRQPLHRGPATAHPQGAPGGIITTVAGNGTPGYAATAVRATSANSSSPFGVAAVNGVGNLYVADDGNNRIRKVDLSDAPSLSFPGTKVGEASASQDVTVLNLGNTLLTISQISTAANFTLGGSDTTCSASSQTLEPAFSCVLGIEFNPTVGSDIIGSVILSDNA